MPRFQVISADGTFYRTDEPDLHKAGDWLVWALTQAGTSASMPARVEIYPLYTGPGNGDWPPNIAGVPVYPVMNLRGLWVRLRDLDKELDPT